MRVATTIAIAIAVPTIFVILGTHPSGIIAYYHDTLLPMSFALWLSGFVVATLTPVLCAILFWCLAKRTRFGRIFHLLLVPILYLIVRGCLELMLFTAREPTADSLTGWAIDPAILLSLLCPVVYYVALMVCLRKRRVPSPPV